jgi:hypothetical protein
MGLIPTMEHQAGLAADLTGKASRQIVAQFGDTAPTRATIRIHSFGVKSSAIQRTMHIVELVYAPACACCRG